MSVVPLELRSTIRGLLRAPTFTIAAVLTLALGVAANTAIFAVVNSVLVNPLPFKNADQLLFVTETELRTSRTLGVSLGTFLDWRGTELPFAEAAAWRFEYFNLTGRDEPEEVVGLRVSSTLLPLLGGQPRIGRGFSPQENEPGETRVAIITDALWRRRFGADPQLVGTKVTIDREPYTIVGILPPTFRFFQIMNRSVDLYVPLTFDGAKASRATHDLLVYARLKPDETRARAQAKMDRAYAELATRYPDTNTNVGLSVRSLPDTFTRNSRPILTLLLGATLMVLVIAFANVTNLLLARATSRQDEMALRAALGADRTRLVKHLLCESIVVALVAGITGVLLAIWGVRLLDAIVPQTVISRMHDFELDRRVLTLSFTLSLVSGVVLGLIPALLSLRSIFGSMVVDAGRRVSSGLQARRLSRFVVTCEVALAVVLSSGALLMIHSARQLLNMPRGLNADHILTMQVSLPRIKYAAGAQVTEFYRDVLGRISRVPGVESASAINFLPLSRLNGGVVPFSIEGRMPASPNERLFARFAVVDPQYFRTMSIPLVAGRGFREQDADESNGVVMIDKTLADRLWPNDNPIGHQIRPKLPNQRDFWVAQSNNHPLTIIGIVGSIKEDGANLMGRDAPVLYVPYRQNPSWMMHLVVRTAEDPVRWARSIRAQVSAVDADQPVSNLQPMTAVIAETFGTSQTVSELTGTFAIVATVLAGLGVFALVCYIVGQRAREIGIRMALGASRADIFRAVLGEGAVMGGAGAVIGLFATLSVNKIIENQLFGVASTAFPTLGIAAALLVGISIAACYVPARRAMNIQPVEALRAD